MRNALTGHRRVNLPLRFRRDEDLGLVATIRAKSGPMAFRRDLIGQPPGGFAGLVRDTTVITIPSATIMPLGVGADAAQTIEAWRGAPCDRTTGWARDDRDRLGNNAAARLSFGRYGRHRVPQVATERIMAISGGDFASALDEITRDWHGAADREVVMSGMIGSRQGWVEVPYVSCPAALRDLANALRAAPTDGARDVLICPGLVSRDADGVPDVMRGEEVQIFGALSISTTTPATVLLPGTHSKHAAVSNGSISGFVTHMTGEVFALLRDHSILGRLMAPRRVDLAAFDAGLDRARHRNGLLHHIFGVRTRMLMNELDAASLPDYLSGILIGHEIATAEINPPVIVVGERDLGALYQRALDHVCIDAELIESDAATTRGLYAVAELRRKAHP